MEIDLDKEESTEISQFINFSIREYVAEIRKKNPAKCWPFGSLGNRHKKVVSSYQSSESTFLSGQNCPGDINDSEDATELTEAPKLSKAENLNGKQDLPETTTDMGKIMANGSSELTFCKVNNGQNRHEYSVDEGSKIRHDMAGDNNELGRTQPRRKSRKFRLLSDIYKDPASELRAGCDRTNPENVNRRFVTEIEDDSDDDVTLAAYFRIQKGVEITDSTLKKRDLSHLTGVEEPSVDQDRKSSDGSKDSIGTDSNGGPSRKKSKTDDKDFRLQCCQKSNQLAEKEKENEDAEMEAVMLLARHFNEKEKEKTRGRWTEESGNNKPMAKTCSKTAAKHAVKKITKEKLENAFCLVQMRSFIPVKATTGGGFRGEVKTSMMKAAGVGPGARNCAALVCGFNRNPADFSTPNVENKFMRGG
ncbi:hypothetical protein SSX86_021199 [Deinandra increscens subsp. villosa]|uniref:Uncharacterized protein n=1 Tax=Deinandra increscens subsp. villosa TaxID=3103831 RepID=A0AAP0GVK6_9ASTR